MKSWLIISCVSGTIYFNAMFFQLFEKYCDVIVYVGISGLSLNKNRKKKPKQQNTSPENLLRAVEFSLTYLMHKF